MTEESRLGRFVKCRCSHTCLPYSNHGFQWILPRTKSKHMLYQQTQQKNSNGKYYFIIYFLIILIYYDIDNTISIDQLQHQLSSFSFTRHHHDRNKTRFKPKRKFKIPILLENELKRKIVSNEKKIILKEFFVKTSYN